MSGNVSEWCYDWKGEYKKEDVISPTGPELGCFRVHRGGGWNSISKNCTVSSRNYDLPSHKYSNTGLRIVLGPKLQIENEAIINRTKNLLQHYMPPKEEVEVVAAEEETEFVGENLSMPDSVGISVEYGAKGYGFTFDIASDHFHTKVTANLLNTGGTGAVVEDEYFINFDDFKKKFEKLRFLENIHWEASTRGTITGLAGRETTVSVHYKWNNSNADYIRREKSFGDGLLMKAVEKLLVNEDVLHRVISIVNQNS